MNPIRFRRLQRQLSRADLVGLTNIAYHRLSHLEHGRQRLPQQEAEQLGAVFEIEPSTLIEEYAAWRTHAFQDAPQAYSPDELPPSEPHVTMGVSLYAARLINDMASMLGAPLFRAMDVIAQTAYRKLLAREPMTPSEFQRMLAEFATRRAETQTVMPMQGEGR